MTACFAKLAPEPWQRAKGGADGGLLPDGGPIPAEDGGEDSGFIVLADGGLSESDGRAPQPTPVCTGAASCLPGPGGLTYSSAATITCNPEPILGPWTLLFEEEVQGAFVVLQSVDVDEPGFGATFMDTDPRTNQVTYRVCVQDAFGTRCGAAFSVDGILGCGCEPRGCDFFQSCEVSLDDGCNGYVTCGACANGAACNPQYHSCCPSGLEPDGDGRCVCAPPSPCPRGEDWDVSVCACQFTG